MLTTRVVKWMPVLLLVAWPLMADAEEYPSRTITMVVPFAAGGGTDALGRLIAQKLAARVGKSVVIENRPGAGSMLGASAVAKADPDGYTLLVATNSAIAVTPVLYKTPSFNPLTDFVPLSMVSQDPFFLAVNPGLPISLSPILFDWPRTSRRASHSRAQALVQLRTSSWNCS
jgi:tripartite-type tricarboxylate transporter receptor subunit TctC